MVKLPFNLLGFSFQEDLSHLRKSFETASAALTRETAAAHDAVQAYLRAVDSGGERIGEWDDDGSLMWEQDQVLEYEARAMEAAAMALCKAYAIAIYHHWERSARLWTAAPERDRHAELEKKTKALGYPIHPRLRAVLCLVNLLKHDNRAKAEALYSQWPEVIPRFPAMATRRRGWFDQVRLTDDQVREIADIVSGSGPRSETLPEGP